MKEIDVGWGREDEKMRWRTRWGREPSLLLAENEKEKWGIMKVLCHKEEKDMWGVIGGFLVIGNQPSLPNFVAI